MLLNLTSSDATLLLQLVQARIDELGPEVHHTDNRDYRADLKAQRAALEQLAQQLRQPAGAV